VKVYGACVAAATEKQSVGNSSGVALPAEAFAWQGCVGQVLADGQGGGYSLSLSFVDSGGGGFSE